MRAKSSVFTYVCTLATAAMKCPLVFIRKAKHPRCIRKIKPPVPYCSHKTALSDTATLRKWFYLVFISFVRNGTLMNVAFVMDNCGPHGADLLDSTGQVSVINLPRNCTSVLDPMDMGILPSLDVQYRSMLLNTVWKYFGTVMSCESPRKHRLLG